MVGWEGPLLGPPRVLRVGLPPVPQTKNSTTINPFSPESVRREDEHPILTHQVLSLP
jgi:hypothetical protein